MASLKQRFEEMIHMNWSEFVLLEADKSASVDDGVLCTLIRTCADTDDMAAIKLAFDRIDGLQETPIEIKVPKFYTRFIKAKEAEPAPKELEAPKETETNKSNYDPATAKLRETLQEMRSMPQDVIRVVRGYKKKIDKGIMVKRDPMVKSVICANLLLNVRRGKFRAIEIIFDQIDGKLTKTISLLGGNDVYIDDYSTLIAPANATKDENGYYVAESAEMTTIWLRGFAQSQKGLEILAEGLEDEYRK